jgi:hypothetical protein
VFYVERSGEACQEGIMYKNLLMILSWNTFKVKYLYQDSKHKLRRSLENQSVLHLGEMAVFRLGAGKV